MDLEHLAYRCHKIASEKGWNAKVTDENPQLFSEKMLLIVSEICEALEEFRDNHATTQIYFGERNKPEGIPIELADTIIRILDFCQANEIDIVRALELKLNYNETRPFRHGNKRA